MQQNDGKIVAAIKLILLFSDEQNTKVGKHLLVGVDNNLFDTDINHDIKNCRPFLGQD